MEAAQQVEDEDIVSGTVKWGNYLEYIKAGMGILFIPLFLIIASGSEVTYVSSLMVYYFISIRLLELQMIVSMCFIVMENSDILLHNRY